MCYNIDMKKYRYKFPAYAVVIILIGFLVAIACSVWNVLRFVGNIRKNNELTVYNYLSFILAILLSLAYIVLAAAALINSNYVITEKTVVLRWGLIKNVIDLREIKEIKLDGVKHRLELVYEDDSYFLIATDEEWYEAFVDELREKFPKIPFVQETSGSGGKR